VSTKSPTRSPDPLPTKPDDDALLLNTAECAWLARISPRSIRYAIEAGELPSAGKRSKNLLVRRTDLLRWLGIAD
jgi:hypothetical protein